MTSTNLSEGLFDASELRRLAMAASAGPWTHVPEDNVVCDSKGKLIEITARSAWGIGPDKRDANAAHIAAANPQTVLALLDRIQSLEAELEKAQDDTAKASAAYGQLVASLPESMC